MTAARVVTAGLVAAALLLSACDADRPGSSGSPSVDDGTTSDAEAAGDAADGSGTAETSDEEEGAADRSPPTQTSQPFAEGLGLPAIYVQPVGSGAGERPELSWDAVDDAARYTVTVFGPDDAPYWAWEGTQPAVRVGGADLPDAAAGPALSEGMSWVVVAHDADGAPIALSERWPISP